VNHTVAAWNLGIIWAYASKWKKTFMGVVGRRMFRIRIDCGQQFCKQRNVVLWGFVLVCAVAFRSIASSKASSPQRVRSSASSFNFYYPFHFVRCLRLLPRLPVTSILPPICPSITCFRRQFLSKMWPSQLSIHLFVVCRICLTSSPLCNTTSFLTRLAELISILQHYISKLSRYFLRIFRSVLVSAPYKVLLKM